MFLKSQGTKIPAGVWVLGFVSLFMDISSELIHSLLPVYMVTGLGLSVFSVGLIEGVAESLALVVKVFSGALSDYLGHRKFLAVIGYGLGAASKPLFALATSVNWIFTARIIDRIGKGIRGAPRDALVADLSPAANRGAAYGLRQSLDTVGAFAGPLLAIGLMLMLANNFVLVFWIAVIPAIIAVALLVIGVHEEKTPRREKAKNPIQWGEIKRFQRDFWWVVGIGAFFMLARFSEAFLVLRAQQSGLGLAWVPMVMVVMNIVYAFTAYPFGKLSDSISHSKLLTFGLSILILADLVLAYSSNWEIVFIGVALWGLHMGVTQGVLANMVQEYAPSDLRGTAFGIFNLASGITLLVASGLAGWLWDAYGYFATFLIGTAFCVIALLTIALWKTRAKS